MKTQIVKPILIDTDETYQEAIRLGTMIPKELIFISLDDKNIQDGEIYYDGHGNLRKCGTGNCRNIDSKKIIARQSQISPKYIQQFIEEYNNGKVEDIEIEMEEVIDPDGLSKLNKLEEYRLHPDDLPNCCFILQPKLTNGFITIIEKVAIVSNKSKYPIGGYAPGNYTCNCVTCKTTFIGDKRAVQCESCAIENNLINSSSSYNIIVMHKQIKWNL